jgi:hypothetical protein
LFLYNLRPIPIFKAMIGTHAAKSALIRQRVGP